MTVADDIRDRAIRHAALLQKYNTGLTGKIIALLNDVEVDLIGKLAAQLALIEGRGITLPTRAQKRLEALFSEIRALNVELYGNLTKTLSGELTELAGLEARFQTQTLTATIPVGITTVLPTPARLKVIVEASPMEGALLSSWTAGMEKGTIDRIEAAIRKGLVKGLSTDEIVRSIRGTKKASYADGVLEISRRSARSVVRTAVTHVSNVAAQETWKANGHVVKAWRFLAALDSRTTITCASYDGQTYPLGQGPIPPLHIACRSMTVPVTKTWKEMGIDKDELTPSQRASMDGPVSGNLTYGDWLKQKGAATQDEVLGPTRAKLFRDGKITLAELIRPDGSVLTLNQLRKAHNL